MRKPGLKQANTYMSHWLYGWAIKPERNELKNQRNTSAMKFVLCHFRPLSYL